MTSPDHEQAARAYLASELPPAATVRITQQVAFTEHPLEGEGDVTVFGFESNVDGGEREAFWVVVGDTQPNYYPHWELTADQAYDLHIGTRFMLVMEVASVPIESLPNDLATGIERFIGTVAPSQRVTGILPAAAFGIENEVYTICRATIGDEHVYVLGQDCPPGIYREGELPPHVVFRRHLGKLIRYEAERESAKTRKNCI